MKFSLLALALGAALLAPAAHAAGAGDWEFKFGVHVVDPKSDNGSLAGGALKADVSSEARPTFNLGYYLTENLQVDLLAAVPFQHDVKLNGVKAARFTHLPPTLSLQYHFAPNETFDPFVAIGLNYTWTYGEHTTGPLAGTSLKLDNSFGPALQGGFTYRLDDHWKIGADVRWMNIDAKAKVDGASVGTVHVDPIAYGAFLVYRF